VRRTVSDWMKHAADAANAAAVEASVEAAMTEAVNTYEWRTILQSAAKIPLLAHRRLAEIASHTLKLAERDREVWGFRDVASVRAGELNDLAGARDALIAGFACFERSLAQASAATEYSDRPAPHGYEWVLLSKGFSSTLNDSASERRCLIAGRDAARAQANADDLCSIATEWAKAIDHDEGLLLLMEAESLACNGSVRAWTLANSWRAVGEIAAAERVLDAALASANTLTAALHVADAWKSHHNAEKLPKALHKARELAANSPEWLQIAQASAEAKLGEAAVRSALVCAEALATDSEHQRRIAAAYRLHLNDADAAERLGPHGLRPALLRTHVRPLASWEGSASALFDALRHRMTEANLTEIANADYGMDAAQHLAALGDLCETGLVPTVLDWEPHEVLALTRWSSGENVNHLERAFACTLLCMLPSEMDELVTNGPILLESCIALGAETAQHAQSFLVWLAEFSTVVLADGELPSERSIALLLLYLCCMATSPSDSRLGALGAQLLALPDSSLAELRELIENGMRNKLWCDLCDTILMPQRASHAHAGAVLAALGR
jgi:hypothetical protein